MGREKDPFHKRRHFQGGGGGGEYEDEDDLYESDLDYEEYDEDDEFEFEDDFDEEGSNLSRRRPVLPLPPFPSRSKNIYPRRSSVRRMPEARVPRSPIRPTHTTRSMRPVNLPDEPRPTGRRSTESYQRPGQQRTRTRSDIPSRPPASVRRMTAKPQPHKHSVWPIFLSGCAAGAVSLVLALAVLVWLGIHTAQNDLAGHLGGQVVREEPNTQTVPLSTLSQLVVCDTAGDISVRVDPNSDPHNAVVTTTKKVHNTDDQNVAKQTFSQIMVSVAGQSLTQPLTCESLLANPPSPSNTTATNNNALSVNVIFPTNQTDQTSTVNQVAKATVDVSIVLPKSVVQSQELTRTFILMPQVQGTISLDGVSGTMNIHDVAGDITVKNGELDDGTKLQAEGKLTFNGSIGKTPGGKLFFSGSSQIDLTLPETSQVMIDATANARGAKITSDFNIPVNTNNGSYSSYDGPFNPAIPPTDQNTAPRLTLQASSGDIAMHKAK